TGLLILTSHGKTVFNDLSQEGQTDFLNTLLEELSDAVPVQLSRLTIINSVTYYFDYHYLIYIGVNETRDEFELSVKSIIKIIDTMVRNNDQTPIGSGRVTRYLKKSYGFRQLGRYFHTLRTDE